MFYLIMWFGAVRCCKHLTARYSLKILQSKRATRIVPTIFLTITSHIMEDKITATKTGAYRNPSLNASINITGWEE